LILGVNEDYNRIVGVKLVRIVIVGFESAGMTAAAAAGMVDPSAKITVFERRPYDIYHPCGIPFAIGGEVPDIKKLIESAPPMPNIELHTATEAISLDAKSKEIVVHELKTKKRRTVKYDVLILATGSYASKPPIPGIDLKGVHAVRTLEDGQAIIEQLGEAKRAAVIGAGLIGVETAAALRKRGLEVLLLEALPSVLPNMLDPDMASLVKDRILENGIELVLGQSVEEIIGKQEVSSISVGGRQHPVDMVIVATGVKPEVRLAKEAGIKLGETGGIKADKRMGTSAEDVYAAGDCVETVCMITGRPVLSQLASAAIRMGRVAGTNAAGEEAEFEGTLSTAVTASFGLEIASTGLTTNSAKRAGLEPIAGRIRTGDRPHYYPGGKPITVKLLVEPKEHRLVGGQVIASDGAAERVNLLALAIKRSVTIEELSRIDYCYVPPSCDVIEPLVVAAEAILRRL
jgi:NADH oxidase (H2O2-forming)